MLAVTTPLGIAVESGTARAAGKLTERYCVVSQTLSTPPELSTSATTR
jgi:hypothetical protein